MLFISRTCKALQAWVKASTVRLAETQTHSGPSVRFRTTEELFSDLYDELRKIAAQRMAHERAGDTLTELEERIVVSARELLDGGRVTEGLGLLADLARQRPEDQGLGAWLANEIWSPVAATAGSGSGICPRARPRDGS